MLLLTIYLHEKRFSTYAYTRNKYRNRLRIQILNIDPNIDNSVITNKQHHIQSILNILN